MKGEIIGFFDIEGMKTLDDIRKITGETGCFKFEDLTFRKVNKMWWMEGEMIGSFNNLEDIVKFLKKRQTK